MVDNWPKSTIFPTGLNHLWYIHDHEKLYLSDTQIDVLLCKLRSHYLWTHNIHKHDKKVFYRHHHYQEVTNSLREIIGCCYTWLTVESRSLQDVNNFQNLISRETSADISYHTYTVHINPGHHNKHNLRCSHFDVFVHVYVNGIKCVYYVNNVKGKQKWISVSVFTMKQSDSEMRAKKGGLCE